MSCDGGTTSKQGPRPQGSGDDKPKEIWGWLVFKIKELRQLLCSNALPFMIRIFIWQLCAGAGALIEHPAKKAQRGGQQRASNFNADEFTSYKSPKGTGMLYHPNPHHSLSRLHPARVLTTDDGWEPTRHAPLYHHQYAWDTKVEYIQRRS